MLSVNTGRFPTRGHKTSRLSSDLWGLSLENHTAFFAISGREECAFCNKVPRYIPPPQFGFGYQLCPPLQGLFPLEGGSLGSAYHQPLTQTKSEMSPLPEST